MGGRGHGTCGPGVGGILILLGKLLTHLAASREPPPSSHPFSQKIVMKYLQGPGLTQCVALRKGRVSKDLCVCLYTEFIYSHSFIDSFVEHVLCVLN